jgi:hypothetical protein
MTGLVIFGSIVVLGLVAVVAIVFGRNFNGEIDALGAKMEVNDK